MTNHQYIFSHYETEWIDGEPTQPYPVSIAVLICQRCRYQHKQQLQLDENNCISSSWPTPLNCFGTQNQSSNV